MALRSFKFGATALGYPSLPANLSKVAITFVFPGKPASGALINVPILFSMTLPGSLSGCIGSCTTRATATTPFTVFKVAPNGAATQYGIISMGAGSSINLGSSGSGGPLVLGDTLQMVAPIVQDATLADVSFSLLCTRV